MAFSRNIDGVEVKYTRADLGTTDTSTIPDITLAGWNAALELDVSVVVPRDSDQPIRASMVFPSNGIYKVFFRMRNNLGILGPITFAGLFEVEEPEPIVGRRSATPLWLGATQNMAVWTHQQVRRLFINPPNHRAVTLNDWDGVGITTGGAFPFGSSGGILAADAAADVRAQYTSRMVDFGRTRRVEVVPSYISDVPPSLTSTASVYQLILRHSTTSLVNAATEVTVTNGMRQEISARFMQARVVATTASAVSVLTDVGLNWRFLD